MGNSLTAAGDTLTCFRKHHNTQAIYQGDQRFGIGRDLDDAVLAATNHYLDGGAANLSTFLNLSVECQNLPNLDTFTRTDAMCVLY